MRNVYIKPNHDGLNVDNLVQTSTPYNGVGSVCHETYAYPWNYPRKAIASPYPTYVEVYRRNHQFVLDALARNTFAAQKREVLGKLPKFIRTEIDRRLSARESAQGIASAAAYLADSIKKSLLQRIKSVNMRYRLDDVSEAVRIQFSTTAESAAAAAHLLGRLVDLKRRFNRLHEMSRADIERLANGIACFLNEGMGLSTRSACSEYQRLNQSYMAVAAITLELKETPCKWDLVTQKRFEFSEVESAILHMLSPKWWNGRLCHIAESWQEHLQIALGTVSKKHNAYASSMAVSDWHEKKRRERDYLERMELEDEDGNRINLIDAYESSVANPAIRRCELMTRIRGFENISNEMGYFGLFCTLTAPSCYHATINTGHFNPKWSGSSPNETQLYLCKLWQKIRAKLQREKIRVFGIRVAEPHHDATPHWHLLLFMLPTDVERLRMIMREYAHQEHAEELVTDKARKARFHAERIDPNKGSATGYIAKYIAKNIDGYALDDELDDESGKPLKDSASAVSAWASLWHIRQFQFTGGAPVTVYRELRRMADSAAAQRISTEFAKAHDAADAGDWAGYIKAQGGPFVHRDELVVRPWYQPDDNLNEYREEVVRLKGLQTLTAGGDSHILTRVSQWKLVPKQTVGWDVDLQDANAASWSSDNNCTQLKELKVQLPTKSRSVKESKWTVKKF